MGLDWQAGLIWLLGGIALGWAGNWLLERSYRRLPPPAGLLAMAPAPMDLPADLPEPAPASAVDRHIAEQIARLDGQLAERAAESERLRRTVELLDQQVMTLNLARSGMGQPSSTQAG